MFLIFVFILVYRRLKVKVYIHAFVLLLQKVFKKERILERRNYEGSFTGYFTNFITCLLQDATENSLQNCDHRKISLCISFSSFTVCLILFCFINFFTYSYSDPNVTKGYNIKFSK